MTASQKTFIECFLRGPTTFILEIDMLHTRAAANAHSRNFLTQMFRSGVDIEDAKLIHTDLRSGKVDSQTRTHLRNVLRSVKKESYLSK